MTVGWIAFACVFGGSVVGVFVRPVLPGHHLSDESKDVVRLGMGLVATMAALVLGLLIASAKSSYDTSRSGFNQVSVDFILLDRTLAHYGSETRDARDLLRRTIVSVLDQIEHFSNPGSAPLDVAATTAGGGALYEKIQELSPKTDAQRWLHSWALQTTADLAQTLWLLVEEQSGSSIPMPFLVVLEFWLTVLFASFGLFGPSNMTVMATLLICSISVSSAIFLILELDRPFKGIIQISSAPLQNALAHLGQ